jgi:hypothetical protein
MIKRLDNYERNPSANAIIIKGGAVYWKKEGGELATLSPDIIVINPPEMENDVYQVTNENTLAQLFPNTVIVNPFGMDNGVYQVTNENTLAKLSANTVVVNPLDQAKGVDRVCEKGEMEKLPANIVVVDPFNPIVGSEIGGIKQGIYMIFGDNEELHELSERGIVVNPFVNAFSESQQNDLQNGVHWVEKGTLKKLFPNTVVINSLGKDNGLYQISEKEKLVQLSHNTVVADPLGENPGVYRVSIG